MTSGSTLFDISLSDRPEYASMLVGGLRTTLISKLTGLSPEQLRYWHKTDLLGASARAGSRGIPRLYSWVDYMRLRIAGFMARGSVPTPRIRTSVHFLDEMYPEWYRLPEITRSAGSHVLSRPREFEHWFIADALGQFVMELQFPDELEGYERRLAEALDDLTGPGADLGEMREYADSVSMSVDVNMAKPTMRGSALETRFVAGLAEDLGGTDEVAKLYKLDAYRVRRAVEFEEAVA